MLVGEGVVGVAYVDDAGPGSDCEGATGGMLAAADCGPDRVDRCRWYLGRYAATAGSVGISPCGS